MTDTRDPKAPSIRGRKDQAVLNALLAGRRITQLEALDWQPRNTRLAGSIERLRKAGYEILTELKRDEGGERFAEYVLLSAPSDPPGTDRRKPAGERVPPKGAQQPGLF